MEGADKGTCVQSQHMREKRIMRKRGDEMQMKPLVHSVRFAVGGCGGSGLRLHRFDSLVSAAVKVQAGHGDDR